MNTRCFKQHTAALALVILFLLTLTASPLADAQTFHKLWDFGSGNDGTAPYAGLTIDKFGNFYGTTTDSGFYGTVFKFTGSGSSWSLTTLHTFTGTDNHDGALPWGRLTIGPDGSLYGTTAFGGDPNCQVTGTWGGCGTVFRLRSPGTVCLAGPGKCPWKETVLHEFTGIPDGAVPFSEVTFDSHGDFYGTTVTGGFQGGCFDTNGCGTVYKFTNSGGIWTETDIYRFLGFLGGNGVGQPEAGVILDSAGDLYGTTACCLGPPGNDTIFKLVPPPAGWSEINLYTFKPKIDGDFPATTLVSDTNGNLYGTTSADGPTGAGTAFQLDTTGTVHTLASFAGYGTQCGSWGVLIMDKLNNLYGTTNCSGLYGYGSVFELKLSGGVYQYVSLHDFTGGTDGGFPNGGLVFDSQGFLYGTASMGGSNRMGVIFQIQP